MQNSIQNLRVRRHQNRAFTLVELMTVVAITSILASVAIPSFIKYVRRATTSEATSMLRKMYDSQLTHYYNLSSKVDRNRNLVFDIKSLSCNFSTGPNCWCFTYSTAYSPTYGIGSPPRANKEMLSYYPSPTGAGSNYDKNPYDYYKSFESLGIGIDSPSRFAYMINLGVPEVSALLYTPGRISYQSFYAEAIGDLDGDGVRSSFRRIGYVNPELEVVGGGGIYTDRPLE